MNGCCTPSISAIGTSAVGFSMALISSSSSSPGEGGGARGCWNEVDSVGRVRERSILPSGSTWLGLGVSFLVCFPESVGTASVSCCAGFASACASCFRCLHAFSFSETASQSSGKDTSDGCL